MTGATENETSSTRRLAEIAFEALREIGCPAPDPQLVRIGSTIIFRDSEAKLIVRIGGDRDQTWRNLRIATAMHAAGIAVLRPVSAEPLDMHGWCVTVWPLVEGGPRPSPQWLGRTARLLHDSSADLYSRLADSGVSLKSFAEEELRVSRDRVAKAGEAGLFSSDELGILSAKIEEIDLALAERQKDDHVVVHGDLYPGNTVASSEETLLIDFDMVGSGPRVVDAAPELVRQRRFPGTDASYADFVEGYGREPSGGDALRLFVNFREVTMVSWIAELSTRKPEVAEETRHRLRTIAEGLDSESWTAA